MGFTYSYVYICYATLLELTLDLLSILLRVSTLLGDSLIVDRMFRYCVVTIRNVDTLANLIILDMVNFDVILRMDWLSHYHKTWIFLPRPLLWSRMVYAQSCGRDQLAMS